MSKKSSEVVEKKKTTAKKSNNKKIVKKDTKKIEEIKEEVKKENKFISLLKLVGSKLKIFFNHPAPLIIVLIVLNFISLLYITRYEDDNQIYVGSISKVVSVGSIHFFTNNDINYFYASTGSFIGEDVEVYNYELGYYVKKGNELIPFATRSGSIDTPTYVSTLVKEFSGWEIVEAYNAEYFFKPEIVPNMGNLYFVINASTKKDSTSADVHYEIPVDATKVTK